MNIYLHTVYGAHSIQNLEIKMPSGNTLKIDKRRGTWHLGCAIATTGEILLNHTTVRDVDQAALAAIIEALKA